jgi:hypothetical protein
LRPKNGLDFGVHFHNPFASPSTWHYPQGFNFNDYYYAVEHFSKYVQPGFQRIAALTGSTELRVTAYYNRQNQQLVLVLINTSASDTLTPAVTLAAPTSADELSARTPPAASQRYGPTAVYRSTFSLTSTERFASLGPLAAGNVVTLPPQAVATVVVDNYIPGCRATLEGCRTP